MSRLSKNIIRAAKSMVALTLCPFWEGRSLSWTLTLGEPEGAVTPPPSQLFFCSAPGSSFPWGWGEPDLGIRVRSSVEGERGLWGGWGTHFLDSWPEPLNVDPVSLARPPTPICYTGMWGNGAWEGIALASLG